MRILLACGHATFKHGHKGNIANAEKPFFLAKNLVKLGHDVTVVYQNPSAKPNMFTEGAENLEIVYLPDLTPPVGYGPRRPLYVRLLRRSIETVANTALESILGIKGNFDVVHSFWPSYFENYLPLMLSKFTHSSRTVIDLEDRMGGREGLVNLFGDPGMNQLRYTIYTFLENTSVKFADAAITSTSSMNNLLRGLGLPANRIFKIPRGVDTNLYQPFSKDQARRKIGLATNTSVVGYMGGSLKAPAYHEILLDAFSRLVSVQPNIRLLLIGRRIPNEARQMILKLRLERSAIVTGALELDELPVYLSAADVLVLPLLNNFVDASRWPNRLLEYMACSRPVVVSEVGAAQEIVTETGCGLIAKVGDPEDLAQKIGYLTEHPREGDKRGTLAREAVEDKFTWSSVAKSTENVYRQIS